MNFDYSLFSTGTPEAIPARVEQTPLSVPAHSIIEGPWSVCPPPIVQQVVAMDISNINVISSIPAPVNPVVAQPTSNVDTIEFWQHDLSFDEASLPSLEELDSLFAPLEQPNVTATNRGIPGPNPTIIKTYRCTPKRKGKLAKKLDDFECVLAENSNSTQAIIIDKLAQRWGCTPGTVKAQIKRWMTGKGDPRITGLLEKNNLLSPGTSIKRSYSKKRKQREPVDLERALNVPNLKLLEVNELLRKEWDVCRDTVRITINDWRLNGTPECKEIVRRYDSLYLWNRRHVSLARPSAAPEVDSLGTSLLSASDLFSLCEDIPPELAFLTDASMQEPDISSTIVEPTLPCRETGSTIEKEYELRLNDLRDALDINPTATKSWVLNALMKQWGCSRTNFYLMRSRWTKQAEESAYVAGLLHRYNQLELGHWIRR
ncbi:MAG: hypothetical protein Q8K75_04420 [Chlamydiales bacterium]|nr:hypothetical protein [Chlamydiales bacterium]